MIDWKTTIPGLIAGIVAIAQILGYQITKDVQDAIIAGLLAVIGIFATSRGVSR